MGAGAGPDIWLPSINRAAGPLYLAIADAIAADILSGDLVGGGPFAAATHARGRSWHRLHDGQPRLFRGAPPRPRRRSRRAGHLCPPKAHAGHGRSERPHRHEHEPAAAFRRRGFDGADVEAASPISRRAVASISFCAIRSRGALRRIEPRALIG